MMRQPDHDTKLRRLGTPEGTLVIQPSAIESGRSTQGPRRAHGASDTAVARDVVPARIEHGTAELAEGAETGSQRVPPLRVGSRWR